MKATLKINDKEIEVEITEEELKKLEDKKPSRKRWRAQRGQEYFYNMSFRDISGDTEGHDEVDDDRYSTGNYFKTKEEAEFHMEEVFYTQMLKDYIYEHDDVKLDWNDDTQEKWSLGYDCFYKKIEYGLNKCYDKFQGIIYASNKQVLVDAVKFIGEDNVKKYILKVEE